MASYSRLLLRMLPVRRWPLAGLGPVWISDPQPACRVLWPATHSLIDRVVNDMEKQMQEMERMSRSFFQTSPLWIWEREDRKEPHKESGTQASEKGKLDGKYQFSVDVAGFAPEELMVKLDGRRVSVTAKRQRESKREEGGYWQERQELHRETLLPLDVDLQGVSCSLTPEGQLCIEAPRLDASTSEKAIPINVQQEARAVPEMPNGKEDKKELGDKPNES